MSAHILIACIVTRGLAKEIMREARQAGASGGTILDARGTCTDEDVKFCGIRLVPEKEILLIMAHPEQVGTIVEAIRRLPAFSQPGGGIISTTKVEEFYKLGF